MGASDIPFALAWRVEKDESRAKSVIFRFMAMEKKKASQCKGRALKGDKTYLMMMSLQFK